MGAPRPAPEADPESGSNRRRYFQFRRCRVNLTDLAHHLEQLARIAAVTAKYLTDLGKEITR
ncbi:hypothetical protein GCM10009592_28500 [Brachybacterium rhamnosum]